MMGEEILDPGGAESPVERARGLGIFPASTRIRPDKITRLVEGTTPSGTRFHAYEIHMGVTTIRDGASPFALLSDGSRDGARLANAAGTYLHGALENRTVLEELLGCAPPRAPESKETHYDRLADWFAAHVNDEVFSREYL
jgi:adenosylcobyric acid synthase